jgi:hypothetical protein
MNIKEFINGEINPTRNFWQFFFPISFLLGLITNAIEPSSNSAKLWGISVIIIVTPLTLSLWRSVNKHVTNTFWKYFLRLQCIISAITIAVILATLVLAVFENKPTDEPTDEPNLVVKFFPCDKSDKNVVHDPKDYILSKFYLKKDVVVKTSEVFGSEDNINISYVETLRSCVIANDKNWKCSEVESTLADTGKAFIHNGINQVVNGKYSTMEISKSGCWKHEQIN